MEANIRMHLGSWRMDSRGYLMLSQQTILSNSTQKLTSLSFYRASMWLSFPIVMRYSHCHHAFTNLFSFIFNIYIWFHWYMQLQYGIDESYKLLVHANGKQNYAEIEVGINTILNKLKFLVFVTNHKVKFLVHIHFI